MTAGGDGTSPRRRRSGSMRRSKGDVKGHHRGRPRANGSNQPDADSRDPTKSIRDSFQASAHQFWNQIEAAAQHKQQNQTRDQDRVALPPAVESVIRVVFGPCTSGGECHDDAMYTTPTKPRRGRTRGRRGRTKSLSPDSASTAPSTPAAESPAHADAEAPHRSASLLARNDPGPFESPPETAADDDDDEPLEKLPPDASQQAKRIEDAVYAHLARDDAWQAEEAIQHLRAQMEHARSGLPPQQVERPPPEEEPYAVTSFSFDDGVSAISQHTLEALEAQRSSHSLDRIHSDITQDPIVLHSFGSQAWTNQHQHQHQQQQQQQHQHQHRQELAHNRSIGSCSKSKSTATTTEFASVWRKDEQAYWNDVAEQEAAPKPRKNSQLPPPRRRGRRTGAGNPFRKDGTITTVNSSLDSSAPEIDQSGFIVVGRATRDDPDRIEQILFMPEGTEMAEI